jgi:hypothetical protein
MKRVVCSILRLVAAGVAVLGGMEILLEFMRHRVRDAETNSWHYLVGSVLIALGITLFAASSKLAARLTDDFDDET